MCWRVSLPVDNTAETGSTPPQHMGDAVGFGGTISSLTRPTSMESERAWLAWGPGTMRYRSCPGGVSFLPPVPPRPALSLHLLHSGSPSLFLSDAGPWTATGPAGFCLGKSTPVYADLGIVRWQNGDRQRPICSLRRLVDRKRTSTSAAPWVGAGAPVDRRTPLPLCLARTGQRGRRAKSMR